MAINKVSIIGAGMTGATTAHLLAEKDLADVVLVDILDGIPQGKALDLQEAMPIVGSDVKVVGSLDYESTKNSDVIVITAGLPRKPGMSRSDLLVKNTEIVDQVTTEAINESPNAIFIVLTNPVDVMAYLTWKVAGISPKRVIGQGGILDSSRMRAFVAEELEVSVENVNCYVIGGHGDQMVPLTRISNIAGVPLADLLPAERLDAIVERTRKAGSEIVGLLKNGSAYFAPAAALTQMIEAVLKDKHIILPASAYLQGEYEINDIFFGVPVQIGRGGVEKIIEYKLEDDELSALFESAKGVADNVSKLSYPKER